MLFFIYKSGFYASQITLSFKDSKTVSGWFHGKY